MIISRNPSLILRYYSLPVTEVSSSLLPVILTLIPFLVFRCVWVQGFTAYTVSLQPPDEDTERTSSLIPAVQGLLAPENTAPVIFLLNFPCHDLILIFYICFTGNFLLPIHQSFLCTLLSEQIVQLSVPLERKWVNHLIRTSQLAQISDPQPELDNLMY